MLILSLSCPHFAICSIHYLKPRRIGEVQLLVSNCSHVARARRARLVEKAEDQDAPPVCFMATGCHGPRSARFRAGSPPPGPPMGHGEAKQNSPWLTAAHASEVRYDFPEARSNRASGMATEIVRAIRSDVRDGGGVAARILQPLSKA